MTSEIKGGLMIDSILFFGLVVVFISGLMIVLSRYNKLGVHSIDYQKYLENNKVPPPGSREERLWIDR